MLSLSLLCLFHLNMHRIRQVFRDLKFPEDDLTLDLVYSIFADKTDRELEIEMIKPRELMLGKTGVV